MEHRDIVNPNGNTSLRSSSIEAHLHEAVIQSHCLLGVLQRFSKAKQHHQRSGSIAIVTGIFGAGIYTKKEEEIRQVNKKQGDHLSHRATALWWNRQAGREKE